MWKYELIKCSIIVSFIYNNYHWQTRQCCPGVQRWKLNSIGSRGNVKEGWKLTPMSSFDVEQGGVNSGPGSRGVLERVRTDGPGFSLCAAPLELSGPGFWSVGQRLGE